MSEELMNEHAAAEILGVTISFLRSRRCLGGGPPFVRVGRLIRYKPAHLDQWVESNTVVRTMKEKQ